MKIIVNKDFNREKIKEGDFIYYEDNFMLILEVQDTGSYLPFENQGFELENALEQAIRMFSERLSGIIKQMFKEVCKTYKYDNIISVRSYTGYENPFQEECLVISKWSSDCWVFASDYVKGLEDGSIKSIPNDIEKLKEEMPQLNL